MAASGRGEKAERRRPVRARVVRHRGSFLRRRKSRSGRLSRQSQRPPPERHAIPLAGSGGGLLLASGQGPRSIQLIFCHGLSTHWALGHPACRSVRKRVLPFSDQVSRQGSPGRQCPARVPEAGSRQPVSLAVRSGRYTNQTVLPLPEGRRQTPALARRVPAVLARVGQRPAAPGVGSVLYADRGYPRSPVGVVVTCGGDIGYRDLHLIHTVGKFRYGGGYRRGRACWRGDALPAVGGNV